MRAASRERTTSLRLGDSWEKGFGGGGASGNMRFGRGLRRGRVDPCGPPGPGSIIRRLRSREIDRDFLRIGDLIKFLGGNHSEGWSVLAENAFVAPVANLKTTFRTGGGKKEGDGWESPTNFEQVQFEGGNAGFVEERDV